MKKLAHKDPTLNLLRILAFGAMGVYVWQVHKKQGSLQGVHANNPNWQINPEVIVDSVMPLVPMNPEHKQLISIAGKNLLRGFLAQKGMVANEK